MDGRLRSPRRSRAATEALRRLTLDRSHPPASCQSRPGTPTGTQERPGSQSANVLPTPTSLSTVIAPPSA